MRLKLTPLVLAGAFAASAHAGSVTTTDWGLHETAETATITLRGPFEEVIRFVLDDAAQLSSRVVAKQVHDANDKKGGKVSLVAERDDVETLIGSYDFGWQTATVMHLFDLQPGHYQYRLSRTDLGSNGGSYELTSTLGTTSGTTLVNAAPAAADAEVPEPPGMPLVLSALAAVGWASRRTRHGVRPDNGPLHRARNTGA